MPFYPIGFYHHTIYDNICDYLQGLGYVIENAIPRIGRDGIELVINLDHEQQIEVIRNLIEEWQERQNPSKNVARTMKN